MKFIIVSEGAKAGTVYHLGHKTVMAGALSLFAIVAVVAGAVGYAVKNPVVPVEVAKTQAPKIAEMKQRLDEYKTTIEKARLQADSRFQVMATQLASAQARLMRLDSMGERLSRAAGINEKELDFDGTASAVGGPAPLEPMSDAIVDDFNQALDKLSSDLDKKSEQLDVLSSMFIDKQLEADLDPVGWPLKGGYVSSRFGKRVDPFTKRVTFHSGVDIASPKGTAFTAMADGVVTWSGKRAGYGNMVEIDHGDGRSTRYGHASALLVAKGDYVKKGQKIGLVGSTGRSTGPHLHFEVLMNGKQINPKQYLTKLAKR